MVSDGKKGREGEIEERHTHLQPVLLQHVVPYCIKTSSSSVSRRVQQHNPGRRSENSHFLPPSLTPEKERERERERVRESERERETNTASSAIQQTATRVGRLLGRCRPPPSSRSSPSKRPSQQQSCCREIDVRRQYEVQPGHGHCRC